MRGVESAQTFLVMSQKEKYKCLAGRAKKPGICLSHLYHFHLENILGL